MKIAKYLFLLLLLLAGTIAVFVATKNGNYTIKKTTYIKVPEKIVFNFLANKNNWIEFISAKENPKKDNSLSVFEKDSIQKIFFNKKGLPITTTLFIKDSLKNTKLTWVLKGKMSFEDKFLSIIGKGVPNDYEDRIENNLQKINTFLTEEQNSFSVKINGFVKRDTLYYIQKPVTTTQENLPKVLKKVLPQLIKLLHNTNTPQNGNPFIIYHKKDTISRNVTLSIAVPTKYKIYTSSDSDIFSGQINPYQAVKTTLLGNYNHKENAYLQTKEYLLKNKLEQNSKTKIIEVLPKNSFTDKLASKWITQIYIPVRLKKLTVRVRPVSLDTIRKTTSTKVIPTNNN